MLSLADFVTWKKSRLFPYPLSPYEGSLVLFMNMAHRSDQIYLQEYGRTVVWWDYSLLFQFTDLNTLESR